MNGSSHGTSTSKRIAPHVNPSVGSFMTEAPHSIGVNQPLAVAHKMMRDNGIRHLPVLRGGELVGLLSQRDLYLVETLHDVDPAETLVEDAMTSSVFQVTPRTSLRTVAAKMAAKKYGCAVVMEDGDVVGIFTHIDALRALHQLLARNTGHLAAR